jgi:hypothetical protein
MARMFEKGTAVMLVIPGGQRLGRVLEDGEKPGQWLDHNVDDLKNGKNKKVKKEALKLARMLPFCQFLDILPVFYIYAWFFRLRPFMLFFG